ncbi:MAG: hypothetical protein AAFV07_13110, partial [Bacteroidota bacterium]
YLKKADDLIEKAAKGMKTSTGKLLSRTIRKAAGKIAAKIFAKLIPGLNIISTAVDLIEVSILLYKVFEGEVEIGFGGGSGEGGEKGKEESTSSGGESEESQGTGSGEGSSEAEAGGEGTTDSAEMPGIPDFNQIDPNDASLYEKVTDPFKQTRRAPHFKPQARSLIEALKSDGRKSDATRAMNNEELHMLNDAIPDDLTDEELKVLIARLRSGKAGMTKDSDQFIGRIMQTVEDIRTGAVEGDRIEEVVEINYDEATRANLKWQETLGWTTDQLGAGTLGAGSGEFVDYVAAFQAEVGINGGGVAGPRTTIALLEALGQTNSPVYDQARTALASQAAAARMGGGTESGGISEISGEGGGTGAGTTEDAGLQDTKSDTPKVPGAESNVGGTEVEGSETEMAGDIPEEEVNDRPRVFNPEVVKMCLAFDEKAQTLMVREDQVAQIQDMAELESYGMAIQLEDFGLEVKKVDSHGEHAYFNIQGSMRFAVTALPENAGPGYPYVVGHTYTETVSEVFDPRTNRMLQHIDAHVQALAGMIEVKHGKAVLKEGIAGTEQDLGDFTAKIMGISNQYAAENEGNPQYHIEFDVIPVDLREFHGSYHEGKIAEAEEGKSLKVQIVLSQGMAHAEG